MENLVALCNALTLMISVIIAFDLFQLSIESTELSSNGSCLAAKSLVNK